MNVYSELMQIINSINGYGFDEGTNKIFEWINNLSIYDFLELVRQIGIIPESIEHDSSSEKLYSKASDIVLSRGFQEIGLKSCVLHERGDSADVYAESIYYNYSLVADSKAFRLSRTAKNQKDYKVVALSHWRQDANFAVLCAPFYQYPKSNSQIYSQALNNNVLIFSWEQLLILLENNIKENQFSNFSHIWNWSESYAEKISIADAKTCFLDIELFDFSKLIGLDFKITQQLMQKQINILKNRGIEEINYWENVKEIICKYSREQAIDELLKEKKIQSKIDTIDTFVRKLKL